MKLVLAGVLAAAALLFSIPLPSFQARLAEPRPRVEYVFGFCGGQSFTVEHAVLTENEKHEQVLDVDYHLVGDSRQVEAEKHEGSDHVIFAFKAEPKDKNGDVKYQAKAKLDSGKQLEINGLIRGDYLVGLLLVDGELGHVLYGRVGKVDDMVKVAELDYGFCVDLHKSGVDAIPQAVADWLSKQGKPDVPKVNQN